MDDEVRQACGEAALDAYCENHVDYSDAETRKCEGESVAVDCITDILHYARRQKWDAERILRCVEAHIEAEV